MSHIYYKDKFTTEEIQSETTPLKAIKNYCKYACCVGDEKEWKECSNEDCFLHPFRLGKNPNRKKTEMTEERKTQLKQNMLNARKKCDFTKNDQ